MNLAFATLFNDHLLRRLARLRTDRFDLLNDVHAINDFTKHDVLAVQPGAGDSGDEELRPVGVGAGVGHRQQTGAGVSLVEVFVRELLTVDQLTTVASAGFKVTTLEHEVGDNSVEDQALVAEALFTGAQRLEVGGGLRGNIVVQFELDGVLQLAANQGLEKDLRPFDTRSRGEETLRRGTEVLEQGHDLRVGYKSNWGKGLFFFSVKLYAG